MGAARWGRREPGEGRGQRKGEGCSVVGAAARARRREAGGPERRRGRTDERTKSGLRKKRPATDVGAGRAAGRPAQHTVGSAGCSSAPAWGKRMRGGGARSAAGPPPRRFSTRPATARTALGWPPHRLESGARRPGPRGSARTAARRRAAPRPPRSAKRRRASHTPGSGEARRLCCHTAPPPPPPPPSPPPPFVPQVVGAGDRQR
jgi:hypothetical protein